MKNTIIASGSTNLKSIKNYDLKEQTTYSKTSFKFVENTAVLFYFTTIIVKLNCRTSL